MKRKVKIKPIYECRCNERLQTKRFMRLAHTGLVVELEHLKTKTRLTKLPSEKSLIEFTSPLGNAIDSGMGLSITIDKLRVFINKTLSILSAYQ
jgi:hypothetical protein